MKADGRLIVPTESDIDLAWTGYRRGNAGDAGIVDHVSFVVMRRLGGGVYTLSGTIHATDSTFSNTTTAGSGGGISNVAGNQSVSDCTLDANASTSAGAGIDGGAAVTINNSIVAQDTYVNSATPTDISGSFSGSYNLIGDGSGGLSATNHSHLGSTGSLLNPQLGPLANNGGPTLTMQSLAARRV